MSVVCSNNREAGASQAFNVPHGRGSAGKRSRVTGLSVLRKAQVQSACRRRHHVVVLTSEAAFDRKGRVSEAKVVLLKQLWPNPVYDRSATASPHDTRCPAHATIQSPISSQTHIGPPQPPMPMASAPPMPWGPTTQAPGRPSSSFAAPKRTKGHLLCP